MKRIDVKALLADPARRRRLLVGVIRATQAREGIDTSEAQAQAAYDTVHAERMTRIQKMGTKTQGNRP
jgi:hypothetical protein